MESLADCLLVILKTNGEDGLKYWPPKDKKKIFVGSDPTCDIRINHELIKNRHFSIYIDSFGKIKIENLSSVRRILVNDEAVDGKKMLKSGDVISLLGNKLRWESKAESRRKTAMMPKSARKASRCMKTRRRITVHKINSTLTLQNADDLPALKTPVKEEEPKQESPPITPTLRNKENLSDSLQVSSLNLSGTLLTSYSPSIESRRSARTTRTPKHLDLSTFAASCSSPVKSALGESTSNLIVFETPNTKTKKSMFLLDLTATAFDTTKTTSTPNLSPSKKTPSKKASVLRGGDNTLLKSAIKNSAIKKKVQATPNRKALAFANALMESPNASTESSLSVVEVNSSLECTVKEKDVKVETSDAVASDSVVFEGLSTLLKTPNTDRTGNFANYTGVASLLKTPELDIDQTSDEDLKQLMDNISSVLDEDDVANASDESIDKAGQAKRASDQGQDVEGNFEKIFESNKSPPNDPASMLATHKTEVDKDDIFQETELENVDKQFDSLIGRPSISRTYPAQKTSSPEVSQMEEQTREEGEKVLKWIEKVRDSLKNEPNNTEQVLSSRYSNITPNDSNIEQPDETPKRYDAATPKVSILQTVEHLRKSSGNAKLTMSPVSRLSVLENSTEIIENYQKINNEMPKSMRSTRKHFGNAMASVNNVSQLADTTIDANETFNMSTEDNGQELNQSKPEEADILSLDGPRPTPSHESTAQCDAFQQSGSNNFIEFAKSNDDGEALEKDIFEISSNETSLLEDKESQSVEDGSSESEESEDESDEEIEEIQDDSIATEAPVKFRLSEPDLKDVEDGIIPLDDSRTDDDCANNSEELHEGLNASGLTEKNVEPSFEADVIESSQNRSEIVDSHYDASQETSATSQTEASQAEEYSEDIESSQNESATSKNKSEVNRNLSKENYQVSQDLTKSFETEAFDESCDRTRSFVGLSEPQNQTEICDDEFEIPATQAIEDDVIASSEPQNEFESYDEEFNIPATQAFEDEALLKLQQDDESFTFDDSSVVSSYASVRKMTQQQGDNQSSMFSDTEFSRVEIDPGMADTESDESPDGEELNDELLGLSDKPSFKKRGVSFLPSDTDAKTSKQRKTLAVHANEELSGSFVKHVENQQELVNIGDKPVSKRGVSLMPEEIPKATTSRKTLAQAHPGLDESLSTSFVKHVEIQRELVNIGDKPVSKRGVSLMPEQIANENAAGSEETSDQGASRKVLNARKTLAIADLSQDDLSESFADFVERQQELINVQDQPNIEQRASSLTPEKESKPTFIRKTMIPQSGELSESFKKYVEVQSEMVTLKDQPDVNSRSNSLSPPQMATQVLEARKTILPKVIELSESFKEMLESHKDSKHTEKPTASTSTEVIDNNENSTDPRTDETPAADEVKVKVEEHVELTVNKNELVDVQPVDEAFCVKKKAYVTTTDEPQTPISEAQSRRPRGARIDYSQLATGGTPKKVVSTPKKAETPRRGRSASVDEISNEPKVKRPRKATKKVQPAITEEQEDVVTVEIEVSGELLKKSNSVAAKNKAESVTETAKSSSHQNTVERVDEQNKEAKRRVREDVAANPASEDVDINAVKARTAKKPKPAEETAPKEEEKPVALEKDIPQAKKSRRAKVVEPTVDAPEDAPVTKTGRRQKVKPVENEQKTVTADAPVEVKVDTKSTDKEVEAPSARSKKAVDKPLEGSSSSATQRNRRLVAKLQAVVSLSSDEEVTEVEKPPKSRRVQKPQVVESETSETVALGRRGETPSKETPQPSTTRTGKLPDVKPDNIAKPRRGTKKVAELVVADVAELVTPRRGRRAASKVKDASSAVSISSSTRSLRGKSQTKSPEPRALLPARQKRERARNLSPPPSTEDETLPARARSKKVLEKQPESSIDEPAPSKRTRRGASKIKAIAPVEGILVSSDDEAIQAEKPSKSRRAVSKEAPEKKTRRGAAKNVKVSVTDSVPSPPVSAEKTAEEPEKKTRRGAAKNVKVSVTDSVRSPPASAEKTAEEPEKKTRRGAAKKIKVSETELVSSSPAPAEKTASMKSIAKEPADVPTRRGRGRKIASEPEAQPEVAVETKVKRTGLKKQVTITTPTQNAKQTPQTVAEDPKATRKRPHPTPTVEEPVVKRSTRSRK